MLRAFANRRMTEKITPAMVTEVETEAKMDLLGGESFMHKLFRWYWPTSEKHVLQAEKEILQDVKVPIKRRFVKTKDGHSINTLEIGSHFTEPEKQHLNKVMVITPGFAAAVGLFYKNFDAFGSHPGLKLYAIDWLGTGRSSRVPFPYKPDQPGSTEGAENFFIDSLEAWREKVGIDKFILFGHSLGGYLSACYAMKYPERVEHLMLISPAGVPLAPQMSEEEKKEAAKNRPLLWSMVSYLWGLNVTPQAAVRALGHLGPSMVKFYTDRRFPDLQGEEAKRLREYSYHFNALKGSGEYALNCILQVGAWARNPLMNRIQNIKAPTTFVYGQYDWMDANAGKYCAERMPAPSTAHIIRNAGHHLYMENPIDFNRLILSQIKKIQNNSL